MATDVYRRDFFFANDKNNKPKTVLDKFLALDSSDTVYISSISVAELFYELEKSSSPKKEQNKLALIKFLSPLEIVSYDEKAAVEYGALRARLESSGQPIGANDMLIASHAKSLDCTIVTNNTREFERVSGLKA